MKSRPSALVGSTSTGVSSKLRAAAVRAIDEFKRSIGATLRAITRLPHLRVVFRGKSAWTDGSTIVIPNVDALTAKKVETKEDLDNVRALLMALRGYAYHEGGHTVETDMRVFEEAKKKHGEYAREMLNLLEDIRVEHRFGKRLTGIKQALEYIRERWVWPRIAKKIRRKHWHKRVLDWEASLALQMMLKYPKTYEEHFIWSAVQPEARSFCERRLETLLIARQSFKLEKNVGTRLILDVVLELFAEMRAEHASVTELWPAHLGEDTPNRVLVTIVDDVSKYLETHGTRKSAKFKVLSLTASDVAKWPRFAGKPVLYLEAVPGEKSGPRPSEDVPDGCSRTLVVAPPEPRSAEDKEQALAVIHARKLAEALNEETDALFLEMELEFKTLLSDDKPYLVYTTENDHFPVTTPGTPTQLSEMRAEVNQLYGPIKRRLAVLLRSKTRTRWRGNQEEGETIDVQSLANVAIAKRVPAELRPFRVKTPRDTLLATSVMLLIDSSGSMRGSRIHLARNAAFCFAECLAQANIEFALYAFSSREQWNVPYEQCPAKERTLYGRFGGLYVERAKDFDEPWLAVAARAVNLGEVNNGNYDADSLRFCVNELRARKASRHVMFVMSDGKPLSSEPSEQVARQQRQLSTVVDAARAARTEVVGIGIKSHSVEQFYKPQCVVVEELADLPRVVLNEMEWLLLGKERRR